MSELASAAIGADSIFPEAVAPSVFEDYFCLDLDELMFSVCESALVEVGTESEF